MKKKNTSKGITLIALVITIIVLLILAGVAISMAIDSGGLFGKANEAAESWNTAVERDTTEITDLLEIVNNVGGNSGDGKDDDTVTLPEGWESSKVGDIVKETVNEGTGNEGTEDGESSNEIIAPIPVGYVASKVNGENTIEGGLVIYEGTEEVNSTNHSTALTTRNQYVWIPVADINQMVMCKSNAEGSVCNLQLVNGEVKCTVHSATATDLCGRLYDAFLEPPTSQEPPFLGNVTAIDFSNRAQIWPYNETETLLPHEPSILSMYDVDDSASSTYMSIAGITSGKAEDLEANMISDFKQMATSVAKYGGFYVSRYEVGQNGASKKNQKVLVAGNLTEMAPGQPVPGVDTDKFVASNTWYGLYNTLKNNTGINTNIASTHMIWGSQYDQILNFIGSESQLAHTRVLNTQILSGENSADIMKNIYDLEGNNSEWTAESLDREGTTSGSVPVFSRKKC